MCIIAGWGAFDSGQRRTFWRYHATALDLAREAGDTARVTSFIITAGRAELLAGRNRAAAKLFELVSLRKKPTAVDWGLLGSAYAPRHPESARGALDRLREADEADTLDARALAGHVHCAVGDYQAAIDTFNEVVPRRSGRTALQETVPLAISCLRVGERALGLRHAESVLDLAQDLRSSRGCGVELRRLGAVLAEQPDSTARDLSRRLFSLSN